MLTYSFLLPSYLPSHVFVANIVAFHSPFSIQSVNKSKLAEDGKESTTDRRLMMENGHPGVEIDEAAIRRGENPYTKYFQQQGEQPQTTPAQVWVSATSI